MTEGAGFEILEHTADLGIRSWGASVAEALEQAAWGLTDVLGIRASGPGTARRVTATGADAPSLLVDFLNELIVLHEAEVVAFAGIRVASVSDTRLEAAIDVLPLAREPEGVGVKAATYHQLRLETRPDGRTEARVYLDV